MRDLEKERELLAKAGLAKGLNGGEAQAVASTRGASFSRGPDEPSILPAKEKAGLAPGKSDEALATTTDMLMPIAVGLVRSTPTLEKAGLAAAVSGDDEALAGTVGGQSAAAEAKPTPLPENSHRPLARLRREAGDAIEQLIALLDDIAGDPDLEEEDEGGGDINDGGENDDDGEASLAVPKVPHWQSQERIWGAASRSRLRNEELEPNLGVECHERYSQDVYLSTANSNPALDELETDLDTEEGDELEMRGECDLASTECIDQTHIGQGDGDSEMNLASTNGIDQRWAHAGSRTDREVDAFPYDPPKQLQLPDNLPRETRARVEAELGERHAENVVELARWRR